MKRPVLLVGNGVNNVLQDYKWQNLIDNLIDHIGAKGLFNTPNKPFPLLYEEIFVEAIKNRDYTELALKEFISAEVLKLNPSEVHHKILTLAPLHLLTTNYDFTFEKALDPGFKEPKNEGAVKETVYNIFRHHMAGNINLWHIHGSANNPSSLTLGYEHYSGYLQQMRNYIVTGTGTSYKQRFESLIRRLSKPLKENHSWLDFFFTEDIYIIGLTLDFIEIHLWWIFTFRQRAMLTNKINIRNKIVYYYPTDLETAIRNKLDLMNSMGIKTQPIPSDTANKAIFYTRVVDHIKNQ